MSAWIEPRSVRNRLTAANNSLTSTIFFASRLENAISSYANENKLQGGAYRAHKAYMAREYATLLSELAKGAEALKNANERHIQVIDAHIGSYDKLNEATINWEIGKLDSLRTMLPPGIWESQWAYNAGRLREVRKQSADLGRYLNASARIYDGLDTKFANIDRLLLALENAGFSPSSGVATLPTEAEIERMIWAGDNADVAQLDELEAEIIREFEAELGKLYAEPRDMTDPARRDLAIQRISDALLNLPPHILLQGKVFSANPPIIITDQFATYEFAYSLDVRLHNNSAEAREQLRLEIDRQTGSVAPAAIIPIGDTSDTSLVVGRSGGFGIRTPMGTFGTNLLKLPLGIANFSITAPPIYVHGVFHLVTKLEVSVMPHPQNPPTAPATQPESLPEIQGWESFTAPDMPMEPHEPKWWETALTIVFGILTLPFAPFVSTPSPATPAFPIFPPFPYTPDGNGNIYI